MARAGTFFHLRTFDGWAAVYAGGEKVYEGDRDDCVDFIFAETGVTQEKDCRYIADKERAAETSMIAEEHQKAKEDEDEPDEDRP